MAELDGYIKLWRKAMDSAVFADPELWKLWCLCLMKASHKERYESLDGIKEPVKLLPGQFVTGRYALHRDFYPRKKKNQKSPLTLWKWMQILEKLGNLNIKSNNKFSVITIINWDSYQGNGIGKEHQNEQQANNRVTTDEQQTNTNKNVKNNIYSPAKEVLEHLNEISGRSFKNSDSSLKPINARLSDGYTVEDCKLVCRFKWNDLKFDKQYFRPQTLFAPSKFEGYLYAAKEAMPKQPEIEYVDF